MSFRTHVRNLIPYKCSVRFLALLGMTTQLCFLRIAFGRLAQLGSNCGDLI